MAAQGVARRYRLPTVLELHDHGCYGGVWRDAANHYGEFDEDRARVRFSYVLAGRFARRLRNSRRC